MSLRAAAEEVVAEWDGAIADGGLVTIALGDPIATLRAALEGDSRIRESGPDLSEDALMTRLSSDNPKSRWHHEEYADGRSAWRCIPIVDAVEVRQAAITLAARESTPDELRAARETVIAILHDDSCGDAMPHSWTEHLPWDDPEDEERANALADKLIAALATPAIEPGIDEERLRRAVGAARHEMPSEEIGPDGEYGWTRGQTDDELAAEIAAAYRATPLPVEPE